MRLDQFFDVQVEGGQRTVTVERLKDIAQALGVEVVDLFAVGDSENDHGLG
ncbi:MAG: hypothetical protein QM621_06865 [Aeromicrobium sp.]|uniref:helix-turn-helix domain-containing protein n=1 Tax=Aeromicrobium sp. TaxID=1871063 RepID=UPI0039E69E43